MVARQDGVAEQQLNKFSKGRDLTLPVIGGKLADVS
jgi:hypothetical protein